MTTHAWEQTMLISWQNIPPTFNIDKYWEFHMNMLHILLSRIKNKYKVITKAGKHWETLFKQYKQS